MSSPTNYWDWLIGMGYGVSVTMIVLRVAETISSATMLIGWLVWLATLSFQTYRLSKLRKTSAEGLPEVRHGRA